MLMFLLILLAVYYCVQYGPALRIVQGRISRHDKPNQTLNTCQQHGVLIFFNLVRDKKLNLEKSSKILAIALLILKQSLRDLRAF